MCSLRQCKWTGPTEKRIYMHGGPALLTNLSVLEMELRLRSSSSSLMCHSRQASMQICNAARHFQTSQNRRIFQCGRLATQGDALLRYKTHGQAGGPLRPRIACTRSTTSISVSHIASASFLPRARVKVTGSSAVRQCADMVCTAWRRWSP
jgi:hypothetical protein